MLSNYHILVTGADGFIGHHVCAEIQKTGAKLSQLVRSKTFVSDKENIQIAVDLTNRNIVAETFATLQPDYVIHLAGEKNRSDNGTKFRDSYDRNLEISLNVIEACISLPKFKRLIFLGSCDEYGHDSSPFDEGQRELPTNAYGMSKLAVTKILSGLYHSCQFPSIVLRPTVIYGPNQGDEMFLSALIQSLLAQKDFAMTYGEQYRDFIYIDDVVDAIIKSLTADNKMNGTVINIGAGDSWQIKKIAILVANLIHENANNHLKFGVIPYRPTEVMNYAVNIDRAVQLLGWQQTTNLEQGLQQTINHFRMKVDARKS